ncbi:hypothetical protein FHR81_003836 [Actinoalloteichus hoggarensis]|uniref:hypothetical protein n=1 Tax=Actinoalloteichus hoggarensis TaxID=1470176 RepID=UPI000B8AE3F5|nr:hypothetical protein [Actinoalloteichus hoggarensis]MBB5922779.1 hypothetical protein [Actinoalloteichus hoggarensis]
MVGADHRRRGGDGRRPLLRRGGVRTPPGFEADVGEGYEGGCRYGSFLGDPSSSYVLGVSTFVDFARYLGSPNSQTREIEVLGFPRRGEQADGRRLELHRRPRARRGLTVQYGDDSVEGPPDVVREKAATVAGLAMRTLTSQS